MADQSSMLDKPVRMRMIAAFAFVDLCDEFKPSCGLAFGSAVFRLSERRAEAPQPDAAIRRH